MSEKSDNIWKHYSLSKLSWLAQAGVSAAYLSVTAEYRTLKFQVNTVTYLLVVGPHSIINGEFTIWFNIACHFPIPTSYFPLLFLALFLSALLFFLIPGRNSLWSLTCETTWCPWFTRTTMHSVCVETYEKLNIMHLCLRLLCQLHPFRPVSQHQCDHHYEASLLCVRTGLHVAWS